MSVPLPRQSRHGSESAKPPWDREITPRPRQSAQVRGDVPGRAPLPPHVVQVAAPGSRTVASRPVSDFSKGMVISAAMSVPAAGRGQASDAGRGCRKRCPRPPPLLPSRSSRLKCPGRPRSRYLARRSRPCRRTRPASGVGAGREQGAASSYSRRRLSSDRTSYASETSLNRASAFASPGFRTRHRRRAPGRRRRAQAQPLGEEVDQPSPRAPRSAVVADRGAEGRRRARRDRGRGRRSSSLRGPRVGPDSTSSVRPRCSRRRRGPCPRSRSPRRRGRARRPRAGAHAQVEEELVERRDRLGRAGHYCAARVHAAGASLGSGRRAGCRDLHAGRGVVPGRWCRGTSRRKPASPRPRAGRRRRCAHGQRQVDWLVGERDLGLTNAATDEAPTGRARALIATSRLRVQQRDSRSSWMAHPAVGPQGPCDAEAPVAGHRCSRRSSPRQ